MKAIKKKKQREFNRKLDVQNLIKYPNCGSRRVQEISSLGKTISIYASGLASDYIGIAYECDSCKYIW